MARRSYLSRIAQPLTAADPVVWSTPRASIEEARPIARTTQPAPARPADPTAFPPQSDPAAARPTRSDWSPPPSTSSAPAPLAAAPAPAPLAAAPAPAPGIEATTPESSAIAATRPPIIRRARPNPAGNIDRPAARYGPISRGAPPDFESAPLAPPLPETFDARAPRRADPAPLVPGPAHTETAARPVEANEVYDHLAASAPESEVGAPRQVAPANRSPEAETRLHIGTIEIRVARAPTPATSPPAPIVVQTPRAAADRLARAYASRFGLTQS
jgi:hypothetical protein